MTLSSGSALQPGQSRLFKRGLPVFWVNIVGVVHVLIIPVKMSHAAGCRSRTTESQLVFEANAGCITVDRY